MQSKPAQMNQDLHCCWQRLWSQLFFVDSINELFIWTNSGGVSWPKMATALFLSACVYSLSLNHVFKPDWTLNNCYKRVNLQLRDTKNELTARTKREKSSVKAPNCHRLFNNSSGAKSTGARQIRYCSHPCVNLLWFFCSLALLSLTTFLINFPRKSNQQGAIIERVN